MMKDEMFLLKLLCMLVNSLFLKLVVSKETRTRTEAARHWVEILKAEHIPLIFDEEKGVFVMPPDALGLECDSAESAESAESAGPEPEPEPEPGDVGDSIRSVLGAEQPEAEQPEAG